jgi:hypothetical protein
MKPVAGHVPAEGYLKKEGEGGKGKPWLPLPVLLFATVLGRTPVWVLLLALLAGRLNMQTFTSIYGMLLICRAYLLWYERNAGFSPVLIISTIYNHWLRWILRSILLMIELFGICVVVFTGNTVGLVLLTMALGFYILLLASRIMSPSKAMPTRQALLKRDIFVQLAVLILWLYVAFTNDYTVFKVMAFCVIYAREFFCIYEPESKEQPDTLMEQA